MTITSQTVVGKPRDLDRYAAERGLKTHKSPRGAWTYFLANPVTGELFILCAVANNKKKTLHFSPVRKLTRV